MANVNTSSGIGLFGVLGVVFVTLKLLGKISWPWIWVLAPFWGGLAAVCVIVIILAAMLMFIKK